MQVDSGYKGRKVMSMEYSAGELWVQVRGTGNIKNDAGKPWDRDLHASGGNKVGEPWLTEVRGTGNKVYIRHEDLYAISGNR